MRFDAKIRTALKSVYAVLGGFSLRAKGVRHEFIGAILAYTSDQYKSGFKAYLRQKFFRIYGNYFTRNAIFSAR